MTPPDDETPLVRPTSLQALREHLRQYLQQEGADMDALDAGSSHPYQCVCETCWRWWTQMGNGEERNPPFTDAELVAPTYAIAMQMRAARPLGE